MRKILEKLGHAIVLLLGWVLDYDAKEKAARRHERVLIAQALRGCAEHTTVHTRRVSPLPVPQESLYVRLDAVVAACEALLGSSSAGTLRAVADAIEQAPVRAYWAGDDDYDQPIHMNLSVRNDIPPLVASYLPVLPEPVPLPGAAEEVKP